MEVEQLAAAMPFVETLGMNVESASPEEVTASIAWSEKRCTAGGVMHGGVIMSVADTVGAVCAFLNLPAGATTSTVESKTNLVRGVRSGSIHARAEPVHVGRTMVVVQTETRDDEGRLVALTTQTQLVLA